MTARRNFENTNKPPKFNLKAILRQIQLERSLGFHPRGSALTPFIPSSPAERTDKMNRRMLAREIATAIVFGKDKD